MTRNGDGTNNHYVSLCYLTLKMIPLRHWKLKYLSGCRKEVHGTNLFQFEVNPEWHNRELSRPTVKIIVNSYKENQAFATMPDSKWCTLALHPKYGIDTYTDSAGNKIKFAAGKPKEKPASAEDAAPVQPIHSSPTAQQNKSGGTSNTSSGGASSGAYLC